MKRRAHKPISPSMVISLIALTLAAGGLASAAIPAADGTIKGCYATTNGLLLGIPHSKGDTRIIDSAETCRSYEKKISWNQTGQPGQDGSATAYATIRFDGTITTGDGKSKNMTSANVTKGPTGVYCISGLPFTPRSAVVSGERFVPNAATVASADVAGYGGSIGPGGVGCSGEIVVWTYLIGTEIGTDSSPWDAPFTIWIED